MRRTSARRWTAAAAVVALGWLASPQGVPVYDGIGAPDQPYRYVVPPKGATAAPAPKGASVRTAVGANGLSTDGLNLTTVEQGPQLSLFFAAEAFAAPGGTVTVTATPQAPKDAPSGTKIDGNVYDVTVSDPAGPVTFAKASALSSLDMRATTGRQPGPTFYHRPSAGGTWTALSTNRAGTDVYLTLFSAPGQYVLAFPTASSGSSHTLLYVLLGAVVLLLLAVVVVVRVRAGSSVEDPPAAP